MGRGGNQLFDDNRDVFLSVACLGSQWGNVQDMQYLPRGGLFASVNLMGTGDNSNLKSLYNDLYVKYLSFVGFQEEEGVLKKKKGGLKLKIKVKNPSLRRLISGGIAGAISRTARLKRGHPFAIPENQRCFLYVLNWRICPVAATHPTPEIETKGSI
ncbi:hypothetical protein BDE02_18G024500 [Populus trichocarpa]|jgi:solute carrier family 25 phosphate transporter 23/24/25/41|nr:hypothetical protein BDE02_18G024500 [Populus trichocarpa]